MGRRRPLKLLAGRAPARPGRALFAAPPRRAVVPKVDLENVEEAFAYAAEREHALSLEHRDGGPKTPRDADHAEQCRKLLLI